MATPDIKALLESLQLSEMDPAEQEETLEQLSNIIFRGTFLRLMERMDDSTRKEFADLVEKGEDMEAVSDFLTKRVPEADQAVLETIEEIGSDLRAVLV